MADETGERQYAVCSRCISCNYCNVILALLTPILNINVRIYIRLILRVSTKPELIPRRREVIVSLCIWEIISKMLNATYGLKQSSETSISLRNCDNMTYQSETDA
ncbi:uncharacterized protein LOC105429279 [Pogonomyrmex barbatus]|uniref:Uncharacterized protein LOC105429279 n=1 Tax=Pogonomyrmex barbatus TaxID=144034 RepID=A0A6I9WLQ9_9HYME|nr:uncharacterized protein LOC105429279 [Pogonomyrmex barbatus]